ncbi:hypothetical protein GQ54DRAFT_192839 [Martensiomyces pterosporus]|nr:hypothetical protein GQ54DRAFT_192839 [Martensiomyces pterosporus]
MQHASDSRRQRVSAAGAAYWTKLLSPPPRPSLRLVEKLHVLQCVWAMHKRWSGLDLAEGAGVGPHGPAHAAVGGRRRNVRRGQQKRTGTFLFSQYGAQSASQCKNVTTRNFRWICRACGMAPKRNYYESSTTANFYLSPFYYYAPFLKVILEFQLLLPLPPS